MMRAITQSKAPVPGPAELASTPTPPPWPASPAPLAVPPAQDLALTPAPNAPPATHSNPPPPASSAPPAVSPALTALPPTANNAPRTTSSTVSHVCPPAQVPNSVMRTPPLTTLFANPAITHARGAQETSTTCASSARRATTGIRCQTTARRSAIKTLTCSSTITKSQIPSNANSHVLLTGHVRSAHQSARLAMERRTTSA